MALFRNIGRGFRRIGHQLGGGLGRMFHNRRETAENAMGRGVHEFGDFSNANTEALGAYGKQGMDAGLGGMQGAMGRMEAMADGRGPSVAQAQLAAAGAQNVANQQAMAAQGRGGNLAAQARQGQAAGAAASMGTQQQMATLRAQEQQAAIQGMGALGGQMAGVGAGMYGMQQNAFAGQQGAELQQQGYAVQQQGQNRQLLGTVLGAGGQGILGAAKLFSDERVKTERQRMAEGEPGGLAAAILGAWRPGGDSGPAPGPASRRPSGGPSWGEHQTPDWYTHEGGMSNPAHEANVSLPGGGVGVAANPRRAVPDFVTLYDPDGNAFDYTPEELRDMSWEERQGLMSEAEWNRFNEMLAPSPRDGYPVPMPAAELEGRDLEGNVTTPGRAVDDPLATLRAFRGKYRDVPRIAARQVGLDEPTGGLRPASYNPAQGSGWGDASIEGSGWDTPDEPPAALGTVPEMLRRDSDVTVPWVAPSEPKSAPPPESIRRPRETPLTDWVSKLVEDRKSDERTADEAHKMSSASRRRARAAVQKNQSPEEAAGYLEAVESSPTEMAARASEQAALARAARHEAAGLKDPFSGANLLREPGSRDEWGDDTPGVRRVNYLDAPEASAAGIRSFDTPNQVAGRSGGGGWSGPPGLGAPQGAVPSGVGVAQPMAPTTSEALVPGVGSRMVPVQQTNYDQAWSDERVKEGFAPGGLEASQAVGELEPQTYQYKPGYGEPGQRVGIMAQHLERTPAGAQLVSDTPYGKQVDVGGMASLGLAASADQEQRIRQLEGALAAGGAQQQGQPAPMPNQSFYHGGYAPGGGLGALAYGTGVGREGFKWNG